MTRRFFIGPNGARFSRPDPLPRWLVQQLESGEILEVTDDAAPVASSASGAGEPEKTRPPKPKGAAKPPGSSKKGSPMASEKKAGGSAQHVSIAPATEKTKAV